MPRITFQIDDASSDTRLDIILGRHTALASRGWAKALILGGHVTVDGEPVKPGQLLLTGQTVAFEPVRLGGHGGGNGPPPDPGEAPELSILFEDEDLVAINKPAGLITHRPEHKRFNGHTVADLLDARYDGSLPREAGEDRPGIVHRLDRETSGVLVVARHAQAFHELKAQWQARTVTKEYRALCFAESRFVSDWIDRPIGPDASRPDRMTVVESGGREAQTFYEVKERFRGFTEFSCFPKTGRTHQIRVHMTSVGHSLVGDRTYKARRVQQAALPDGAPNPGRHCLHAVSLELEHPRTRDPLRIEAPMPADMLALSAWFRAELAP